MKNVAILLGVSHYLNASDLPACANDINNVQQVLEATEKYQILKINEEFQKKSILDEIERVLKDDNNEIGEIFFYFSGHGYQDQTDFHYILQETDINKINSTSLNNAEIDDLVRKYNPKLFVKIIDACQSGLNYIKGIEDIENHDDIERDILSKASKRFTNCIFMSSSKRNENSGATEKSSFFTDIFISAVFENINNTEIRYTDIQNYIIDEFSRSGLTQTPYFSIQDDGRSVFTNVTQKLIELTKKIKDASVILESNMEAKLDKFINAYRTEEEVKKIIQNIQNVIVNEKLPIDWIAKYYDVTTNDYSKAEYLEEKSILKFLYEKEGKENLYIRIDTEKEKKDNIFGIPFLGYDTVPIRFHSLACSLPLNLDFSFIPKDINIFWR